MAKDLYHQLVKDALMEEGWEITHDPYVIRLKGVTFNIDLGAEQLIGAEKGTEKIAVEVKSFLGPSPVYEFHEALGQFINYLVGLEQKEPARVLYLAVPEPTYEDFFQLDTIRKSTERGQLKIIVFGINSKKITQWIK